jgi:hypothetical protein
MAILFNLGLHELTFFTQNGLKSAMTLAIMASNYKLRRFRNEEAFFSFVFATF